MIQLFTLLLLLLLICNICIQNWSVYDCRPFDKVYVITLERTKERAYPLLAQLCKFGYRPEIYYGVDGKKAVIDNPNLLSLFSTFNHPGEIGCWLSHYNLLQKVARMSDNTRVLIFEDDANVTEPIKLPFCNYDMFYFGFVGDEVPGLFHHVKPPFYRSYGHAGTHAYSVTSKGAKKILQAFQEQLAKVRSLPIDLALMYIFEIYPDIQVFTSYPVQVWQKGDDSVIRENYK